MEVENNLVPCEHCPAKNRSTIESFGSLLSSFLQEQKEKPLLFDTLAVSVDIGATHIRVALAFLNHRSDHHRNDIVKELQVPQLLCNRVKELVDTFHFLSQTLQTEMRKHECAVHLKSAASAMAVAGPVNQTRDHVNLTNYDGENIGLSVSQLPAFLFPQEPGKTRFINDLEAACYGIIFTGQEGRLGEYFEPAFDPQIPIPSGLENHHYAVLAMGTGLGTGMIISRSYLSTDIKHADGDFAVMPLEAGHCLVPHASAILHTEEAECFDALSKEIYGSKHSIEFEDICSGRGLTACYRYELSRAGLEIPKDGVSSAQIAAYAMADEEDGADDELNAYRHASKKAMLMHYTCLMKAAQNLCVMVPSCKGLFLAGGNQVLNKAFFKNEQNHLKNEFLHHPKRNWLEEKKVFCQTNAVNFNLVGALWVVCNDILHN